MEKAVGFEPEYTVEPVSPEAVMVRMRIVSHLYPFSLSFCRCGILFAHLFQVD